MKQENDNLLSLIQSMEAPEKIYFKSYGKGNKKENADTVHGYIKLFDIINSLKQKKYSPGQLRKVLRDKGFSNDINKAKKYLTKEILKALCDYHENKSPTGELVRLLSEIEILVNKRLHKLASKKIVKAENLALRNEQYEFLLRIGVFKRIIHRRSFNVNRFYSYMKTEALKQKKYLACLSNNKGFEQISNEIFLLTRTGEKKEIKSKKYFNKGSLLSSPDNALTFYAKQEYYENMFAIAIHNGRNMDIKIRQRQEDWIAFLESDKSKIVFRTSQYLIALSNLLIVYASEKKFEKCELVFNKAVRFTQSDSFTGNKADHSNLLTPITINFIASQNEIGCPEKAISAFDAIKDIFSAQSTRSHFLYALWNNLFISHFLSESYKLALPYINNVLNTKTKDKNEIEIQSEGMIFKLIIHFELENYELLYSSVRQSKRFLTKHKKLTATRSSILFFFEDYITHSHIENAEKKRWLALKSKLGQQQKDNIVSRINAEKFDYISWVNSKITGRRMVDIINEKAHQSDQKKIIKNRMD